LAALKQDAKDFKWRQMANQREKRIKLEPLCLIAKTLLRKLAISQRNRHYCASLVNFCAVYDLRHIKAEQRQGNRTSKLRIAPAACGGNFHPRRRV
jgi:hypothetical protein